MGAELDFTPSLPPGQLARRPLAFAAAEQERAMPQIDPRDVRTVHLNRTGPGYEELREEAELIGTPLRDAAVDPQPGDFPGVVNAGLPGSDGDPHGPNVRCIEVGSLEWNRRVAEQRAGQAGAQQ